MLLHETQLKQQHFCDNSRINIEQVARSAGYIFLVTAGGYHTLADFGRETFIF